MKTYTFLLEVEVQVQAFNEDDAYEAVEDTFGTGNACGLDVTNFKVVHKDEGV